MNVHAHLFTNEIIGYTWGYVVKTSETQTILIIHDCNVWSPLEDIGADRTKTVEMDPESARLAHEKATDRSQLIIGWYHSHPQFEVDPSNIDVLNHKAYQNQFNNDACPFVALIVGTFAQTLETFEDFTSLLNWFHVAKDTNKK